MSARYSEVAALSGNFFSTTSNEELLNLYVLLALELSYL